MHFCYTRRLLFAACVSMGVLLAHLVLLRHCTAHGLDPRLANRMVAAALAGGMLAAHVAKFLYHPARLLSDPSILFGATAGISSFGGIAGGLLCGIAMLRASSVPVLDYIDALAYAFPFGWILGRLGCVLVGDHPGLAAHGWFTRDFDGVSRYDLGLIELVLFTLPVAGLFIWLSGTARRSGFYLTLFLVGYGPFRILLDQLHEQPPRYGPLSVDQWFGLLLTAAGLGIGLWLWRQPAGPNPPAGTSKAPARC
jgi:phosphatidylglycerol---prolipoprotein diacylglyceryl transferase